MLLGRNAVLLSDPAGRVNSLRWSWLVLVGAVGFEPTTSSSQSPDTRREAAWSGRYQAALFHQRNGRFLLVSRIAYESLDGPAALGFLQLVLEFHGFGTIWQ